MTKKEKKIHWEITLCGGQKYLYKTRSTAEYAKKLFREQCKIVSFFQVKPH